MSDQVSGQLHHLCFYLWLLVAGCLVLGLILAILTYHLRARWGTWGGSIL